MKLCSSNPFRFVLSKRQIVNSSEKKFLGVLLPFLFTRRLGFIIKMLQWMGGSRRKVTTSRKSTQNRQKQYFEQRKRRQQMSSGLENCHDAVETGKEKKEHRSLDILSFLNLSTIPQEKNAAYTTEAKTSTVLSHFVKDPAPTLLYSIETLEKSAEFQNKQRNGETGFPSGHKGETLSPMKQVSNDLNNHNNAKNKVDSQPNQGMKAVDQSLSIFDLLGDDGMVSKSEGSPMKEDHVAFSVDGLGRVGMETPACSPQHVSRSFSHGFSSHLESMRSWNSSKNIKVLDDFELERDIIMPDIKRHHDDGSLNYSLGMMDTCDNLKKSPAKTSFHSVEDCKRNEHYGGRSIFDGTDGERDICDGGVNFLNDDFLEEMEYDFFEKSHFNETGSVSPDFPNYGKYVFSENAFDSPYLPKKRGAGAKRTMDKFNLFDSVKSSSKHYISGYDYDLMSDAKRNPKATKIVDFKDKSLQPDWFCSMADEATDNFSLLSEESCSTSAVRGETFNRKPFNPNPRLSMRRGMDDDSGHGNSYSMYSRDPDYKIRDEAKRGDHAHKQEKHVRKSNSSKLKPVHHSSSPCMEELPSFKSWSFEKDFNLSSPCRRPAADRPFRSSMPWTEYPSAESALPESSFTNKHFETVPHPCSSSISKRPSFQPSNIASGILEHDLRSNSKLVGTYKSIAKTTSSHGEGPISPALSAEGSVGTGEKSESKVPSLSSEKVSFHEEKCGKTRSKNTDREWLDDSNCESMRKKTENESLAEENLEASHYSDHIKNDEKFNHDDKVSVPCSKGENEVKDVKLEGGRRRRSKSCGVDSSSPAMMFESYVLQLLYVQKVLLKQASSQDFMKNA